MGIYNDIDLNFELDAKGDLALVDDIDAVNQGLRILVETITGSRPGIGNENFGISLRRFLFNELNYVVADQIGNLISTQIGEYEPRIEVENISVEMNQEQRAYLIEIWYTLINTGKSGAFRMIVETK